VDLAFDSTGRITSVPVEVGDHVRVGQKVTAIGTDVLLADLRAAEVELEEVKREQTTLVESAYRRLLSDDLAAVPESSYGINAPVLTGLYRGSEGSYRVRIVDKENSNDFEMRVFGLEEFGPVVLEEEQPTPLGTYGLYVNFPDAVSEYDDTIWNIAIPNTKGVSYRENRRAYDEALSTREKTIANATAAVQSIKVEIGERTIRAPFSGVVTAVEAKVGAIASPGEVAVSLQSDDTLQIESFVPEVNIAQISVGDKARVTLDAYGEDASFEAAVVSIDPAETIRDGVSTYRAVLQFSARDERIKSGMTANVTITTDEREAIVSIPRGAVLERDGVKYVQVRTGEATEEREVTTGKISSLGNIEIVSGLSEGDIIVLPIPQ
jgi:multidrug efflux pump subunit AcrA (membrane-fusion protein)